MFGRMDKWEFLIIRALVWSRILVFLLQFVANILIPDHDADAFRTLELNKKTFVDDLIQTLLGGYFRWDAQHFVHIARFGYTFENNLAFYPLFPLLMRATATVIHWLLESWISFDSAILLCGFLMNFVAFIAAGYFLFLLTRFFLGNVKNSVIVGILFAVNPSSIFFSAIYSESLYSAFTFSGLYWLCKSGARWKNFMISAVLFALSLAVRANGFLNFGFIGFALICKLRLNWRKNWLKAILFGFFCGFCAFVPFFCYHYYVYCKFCGNHPDTKPDYPLIEAGLAKGYVIYGVGEQPEWCFNQIPVSYSAIQKKYWDVEVFGYWKLRKLPLFAIAFPALYIATMSAVDVFQTISINRCFRIDSQLPFALHTLFIVVTAVFVFNVDTVTRMLCSSTPLFYWYCAKRVKDEITFPKSEECNVVKLFAALLAARSWNRLICYYFIGYVILGILLHSNYLPWT